jgi:hypothetical protein
MPALTMLQHTCGDNSSRCHCMTDKSESSSSFFAFTQASVSFNDNPPCVISHAAHSASASFGQVILRYPYRSLPSTDASALYKTYNVCFVMVQSFSDEVALVVPALKCPSDEYIHGLLAWGPATNELRLDSTRFDAVINPS